MKKVTIILRNLAESSNEGRLASIGRESKSVTWIGTSSAVQIQNGTKTIKRGVKVVIRVCIAHAHERCLLFVHVFVGMCVCLCIQRSLLSNWLRMKCSGRVIMCACVSLSVLLFACLSERVQLNVSTKERLRECSCYTPFMSLL